MITDRVISFQIYKAPPEERMRRIELALKKEGIPINDDNIRAFEAGLKVKVVYGSVP